MQNPLTIGRCGAQYDNMQHWLQIVLTSYHCHGCFHNYNLGIISNEPIGHLLSLSPVSGIYAQGFSHNSDYDYYFLSLKR